MSDANYLSDDHDPFDNGHHRAATARSSSWVWIVGIISAIGLLGMGACCGGVYFLFRFGNDVFTEQVRAEIEDNAVIQEHIGNISETEMDLTRSAAAAGDDVFVFRIAGDNGSGFVTVESITIDEDTEDVVDGSLKLDTGETIPLFDDAGTTPETDAPTPETAGEDADL